LIGKSTEIRHARVARASKIRARIKGLRNIEFLRLLSTALR
jgi:hypothetical protein